ncbi:MAG: PaaI family thioesterase, partial [Chloroflexota bacterium]
VVAQFTPRRQDEGVFDVVHGGIVGTMLDEAMAWAAFADGVWAVTARMELRFRQPVVVGTPLEVRGVVTANRGRLIETTGTITRVIDGAVLAEASGTFMRVPEAQAREWQDRYLNRGGV